MDLEEFLKGQAGVGRLESSGQFTLDLETSREKLRQFQLSDPGFYLLKVVQAAVAAGAPDLKITTTGGRITVEFTLPQTDNPLNAVQVMQALALRPSSRPARHLAVGLNAAIAHSDWAEWTVHSPGLSRTLKLTRTDQEILPADPTTTDTHSLKLEIKKTGFLLLPASTTAERSALARRCAWTPIPVLVNGQPLPSGLPPPEGQPWHEGLSRPCYLDVQHLPGRGLKVGDVKCRGVSALSLGLAGTPSVVFVQDGVALDPEPVPTGLPGAVAVLLANDLTVDLSQFKAVQDGVFMRRVDEAWEGWVRQAQRIDLDRVKGVRRRGLLAALGPVGRLGDKVRQAQLDRHLRQRLKERLEAYLKPLA